MTTPAAPRKRRNRVLCLHGPTQSAASFRAALKPLCDQLGHHWEFHFLEAPYVILDEGDTEEGVDAWTRAAVHAGKMAAMESDGSYEGAGRWVSRKDEVKKQMTISDEGRQVLNTLQQGDVEGLVARKTGRSLSRNWVAEAEGEAVGVQLALAQIGDYIRENGTFHGVIGYETGAKIALLLQSLLSHPLSSAGQFPSFFPQLPKGVQRMPRMGGWEEEPPPPDDARLGRENLTKDYVPAQKPFEMVVAISPTTSSISLGRRAEEWTRTKPAILSSASPDSFQVHSISINASSTPPAVAAPTAMEKTYVCKTPNESVLDPSPSRLLAQWMSLAVDSCQGGSEARVRLVNLERAEAPSKL